MKVCKCDRCGEIFEPRQDGRDWISRIVQVGIETFDLINPVGEIEVSYDICDNCYNDFLRWMRRGTIKKIAIK